MLRTKLWRRAVTCVTYAGLSTVSVGVWAQVYTNTSAISYQPAVAAAWSAIQIGSACTFTVPSSSGGTAVVQNPLGSGQTCALILPMFAGQKTIANGQVFKSTVRTTISTSSGSVSGVAAGVVARSGFTLVDASGNKEDLVPYTAEADHIFPNQQTLVAELIGGQKLSKTGNVATKFEAWMMVDNIKPGQTVTMQLPSGGSSLAQGTLNPAYAIMPLEVTQTITRGKPLRLTVDIVSKNGMPSQLYSAVQLINGAGFAIYDSGSRALTPNKVGSSGVMQDVWQITPLPNLPNTFRIRYQLLDASGNRIYLQPMTNSGVTDSVVFSTYLGAFIGQVTLTNEGHGGMHVGMAFHDYWGPQTGVTPSQGPSQATLGNIQIPFSFARSGANQLLSEAWWSVTVNGSTRTVNFDWNKFDAWANKLSPLALKTKSLLVDFHRSPVSSSDPNAQIKPPHLGDLATAVYQTVNRYKDRIFAVECWNEPELESFFLGTRTQLADVCKVVYQQTKSVSSSIPVICPQAADPQLMGFVLSARTSDNQPITNYCDWVGAHSYTAMGNDTWGQPRTVVRLADRLRLMKHRLALWGVTNKPLAMTEMGMDRVSMTPSYWVNGTLEGMTDNAKAEAAYNVIGTLQEAGVRAVGLYSYDHGAVANLPGGYFWLTNATTTNNPTAMNATVVNRVNQAINEVTPTGTSW